MTSLAPPGAGSVTPGCSSPQECLRLRAGREAQRSLTEEAYASRDGKPARDSRFPYSRLVARVMVWYGYGVPVHEW